MITQEDIQRAIGIERLTRDPVLAALRRLTGPRDAMETVVGCRVRQLWEQLAGTGICPKGHENEVGKEPGDMVGDCKICGEGLFPCP